MSRAYPDGDLVIGVRARRLLDALHSPAAFALSPHVRRLLLELRDFLVELLGDPHHAA